jgi:hypothetical protein
MEVEAATAALVEEMKQRNRATMQEGEKKRELSVTVNPNTTGIYIGRSQLLSSWAGNGLRQRL